MEKLLELGHSPPLVSYILSRTDIIVSLLYRFSCCIEVLELGYSPPLVLMLS